MIDDLDELKTFVRIVAAGSLSAAARELGMGLGVVSKRLATLERRVGVRLINRTTRHLSPTTIASSSPRPPTSLGGVIRRPSRTSPNTNVCATAA